MKGAIKFSRAATPVSGSHVPKAGVRECGGGVLQADIGSPITFALECQHRVRSGIHATVDVTREMHTEKWETKIGHRIEQAANQMLSFWNQIIIFTTKRHDR